MNSLSENSFLYKRVPLEFFEEIPVFSPTDSYIENYNKISFDHVSHMKKGLGNPFMDEEHWALNEKITAELIKKHSLDGQKILDVGVGLGRLLAHAPELERYGVDISKHYLPFARDQGIQVCLSKIEELPYHDNFFDLVVCTDVLEHVVDLNLCIKKILNVVKPKGKIIIRTPYKESLKGYLVPEYPYHMAHLRNFDEYGLRLLFEKVFKCEFMEIAHGGYLPVDALLKYNFPIYKWKGLVRKSIRLMQRLDKKLAYYLTRWLYFPAEINIVFCKSS